MNKRNHFKQVLIVVVVSMLSSIAAHADPAPELFCTINSNGEDLNCQYKDKRDSSKVFSDDDIISFTDRSMTGGYITVKSKRGFERTFEVDPDSHQFKQLREAKKNLGVSELAKVKLETYQDLERKAIQVSDGLDAIYVQSDMLKYDPAIAADKCKMDMKLYSSGVNYEKNLESLSAENKTLSIYLTSLLKAFKDPGSCLSDYKMDVSADGTVELSQLQGISQAFKNRCKKKL